MKTCPYCGKKFKNRSLPVHLGMKHPEKRLQPCPVIGCYEQVLDVREHCLAMHPDWLLPSRGLFPWEAAAEDEEKHKRNSVDHKDMPLSLSYNKVDIGGGQR